LSLFQEDRLEEIQGAGIAGLADSEHRFFFQAILGIPGSDLLEKSRALIVVQLPLVDRDNKKSLEGKKWGIKKLKTKKKGTAPRDRPLDFWFTV
jgi:hypothetical protein